MLDFFHIQIEAKLLKIHSEIPINKIDIDFQKSLVLLKE